MRPRGPRLLAFLLGIEIELAASTGVILEAGQVPVKKTHDVLRPGRVTTPTGAAYATNMQAMVVSSARIEKYLHR